MKLKRKVAEKQINVRKRKAKRILKDTKKFEKFFDKLERKTERLPKNFKYLKYVGIFGNMILDYYNKEFKEVPLNTILCLIACLLYLIFPHDIIPDYIPIAGFIDDCGVFATILTGAKMDIDSYLAWRKLKEKSKDQEAIIEQSDAAINEIKK